MKNPRLIILVFTIFSIPLIAQNFTVDLSEDINLGKEILLEEHLFSDSTAHYLYFTKRNRSSVFPCIYKFDAQLNLVFKKTFKPTIKRSKSLGLKYTGGKFTWMFYKKNVKKKTYDIYMADISMTGESSTPKKLVSLKYDQHNNISKLDWIINKEKTNILFIAEYDKNSKTIPYKSYVNIIDNNNNSIFEKKIIMNYTKRRFETSNWGITSDSKIYFVGKIYENDRLKEDRGEFKKSTSKYNLYTFSENKDIQKTNVDLDDFFIRGISIKTDKQSNFIGGGLISNSSKSPIIGTFYFKIINDNIVYKKEKRFTYAEIKSFGEKYTSKERKTNDIWLSPTFELTDLILQNDGSFNIIMEDNFLRSKGNLHTGPIPYFVSNSIIYSTAHPNEKTVNVNLIPKRQDCKLLNITSHSTFNSDDRIYFLYNDSNDNFDIKRKSDNIKIFNQPKKSIPVIAYFEDDKIIRKKLIEENGIPILAKKSKQISNNKVLFFHQRGNRHINIKFRIGLISINQ